MHLYYMFSEPSEWTNLDEALLAFVSDERKKKIRSFRFPKEKKLSLYAALLLPFACTDQYDLPFAEIDPVWPQKEKPRLQSHPEIHFSISHSGNCVAVAVSDEEVGLDAELIAKAPMKTMNRAFSPNETDQIQTSDDPNLEFYRIWTRKEAYGKFLGTGLSNHVLKSDTLLPEHTRRISEGILTPEAAFSKDDFKKCLQEAAISSKEYPSSALYYSVYGKKEPAELISVSPATLLEYYLLCV
ncbi:MAG: 4'-phosphopantetheinyl transferase superfamily protein [Lachnospiraceae bacterium]|nr:4'-phosphopantetheinyl transferase superfamily protein [Lachnospiraceae bacterium]